MEDYAGASSLGRGVNGIKVGTAGKTEPCFIFSNRTPEPPCLVNSWLLSCTRRNGTDRRRPFTGHRPRCPIGAFTACTVTATSQTHYWSVFQQSSARIQHIGCYSLVSRERPSPVRTAMVSSASPPLG